eukprot:UN0685
MDLLSGTRSRLSFPVQVAVSNTIQKYYIDPNLVKPIPESMQCLVPGSEPFSEWFQRKCKHTPQPRSPEYWTSMAHDSPESRRRATEHLGHWSWRENLRYQVWIYKEEGIRPAAVPEEFREIQSLKAVDIMWLEIFGAYLVSALEALAMSPGGEEHGRMAFHLGIVITDNDDRQYCPHPGPVVSGNGCCDTFLLCPTFSKRPADHCTDNKSVKRAVFALRSAAVHSVAHLMVAEHGKDFIQQVEDLSEALEEVEVTTDQSWFHNYRRHLDDRIMRDVQEGREVPELVRHMAAIEASMFKHDSTASASALHAEIENARRMMVDAFGGRNLTGLEERPPFDEFVQRVKAIGNENQQLRGQIHAVAMYKTVLCSHYQKGRCRYGGNCSFAHDTAELRMPVPA